MARSCRWEVETLFRSEWQRIGCFKSKKTAQRAALDRQAESGRDVSVVSRNADGSVRAVYGHDHQRRQWRKLKWR